MFGLKSKIQTDKGRIHELLSRGVAEVIDRVSLEKKLQSGVPLKVKLGIDPTSPNLHIGRSVLLLKLRDFQELGHRVVLIIGDATGVIGDTSDKTSERPMLTRAQVKENAATYFDQAGKILDMTKVEKRFNSEWLHTLSYDDIGEHADQFSVADFIARDNIKHRLDEGKRVSLREVLYPLMQGYDSVAVKADVELGGVDQRFNLLAGRKLQERFGQAPQDILMTNLVLGTDGRKMSSSWGNTINVTDIPNDMYGKVMSVPDELIIPYFIHCTRVPMARIGEVEESMNGGLNPRDVKMELARAIVTQYHGAEKAADAERHFVGTFQKGLIEDAKTVSAHKGTTLRAILIEYGIVPSGNEFVRLVKGGAITELNSSTPITDPNAVVTASGLFQIGKRRFINIRVQ